MPQHDRHLTTEQLSASLDQQLSSEEHDQLDAHLKACEPCQIKLQDLRQMVALLHALPQPQVSRSFTITTEALETPRSLIQARASMTTRPNMSRRYRTWPAYARTTLRGISTLAAVLGIVFLLSGMLPSLTHSSGGGASMTQSGASRNAPGESSSKDMTPHAAKTPNHNSQARPATATPQSQPAPPKTQAPPTSTAPPPLLDLGTAMGRVDLGIILLILGIMGFVILRVQRRRARAG